MGIRRSREGEKIGTNKLKKWRTNGRKRVRKKMRIMKN